jgi:hypothetical protein
VNETEEMAPSMSHSQFLRIALDALAARAARWVSLCMAFGLFLGATWYPSWIRLASAATFTILVNLPLWWRREK